MEPRPLSTPKTGIRTMAQDMELTKDHGLGVSFENPHVTETTKSELTKPAQIIDVETPQRSSIYTNHDDVFNVANAFDDSVIETGTIVSDKRRTKSSFIGMLGEAFNEWWGGARENIDDAMKRVNVALPKKEALPTVPKPELRKETIEKAAQYSAQAPRDDHRLVLEKLKTNSTHEGIKNHKSYQIKEKPTETAPRWGSTVEEVAVATLTKGTPEKHTTINEPDLRKTMVAPSIERPTITKVYSPEKDIPSKNEDVPNDLLKVRAPERRESTVIQKNVAPAISVRSDMRTPSSTIPKDTEQQFPSDASKHVSEHAGSVRASLGQLKKSRDHFPQIDERLTPRVDDLPKNPPAGSKEDFEPALAVVEDRDTSVPQPVILPHIAEESIEHTTSPRKKVSFSQKTEPVIELHAEHEVQAVLSAPDQPTSDASNAPTENPESRPEFRQFRAHSPSKGKENLHGIKTPKLLKTALIGSMISIGAVVGVGAAFYMVHLNANSPQAISENSKLVVAGFFVTESTRAIALPQNKKTFLASLIEGHTETPGIERIYPVVNTNGTERPASTEEIFATLDPHVSSAFIRTLDPTVMIGYVHESANAPYIILRSNTFDNAFAGMLEWEANMSADLDPFFGPTVERTTVPQSAASSSPAHFVDALTSNRSIRILYDETGNERVIYALINRNTIIITTSTPALSELISRL